MSAFTLSLGSIAVASLLGSLHCVGMCGAFAAMACSNMSSQLGYHLGRLSTYLILGAAAGLVGEQFNLTFGREVIEKPAALFIGLMFLIWGVGMVLGNRKANYLRFLGAPAQRFARRMLSVDPDLPRSARSFLIGFATTFLPCGFLYAFVALAVVSGTPLKGMLTMAFFWVGTLPALVLTGGLARRAFQRFGSWTPVAISLLFICSGLVTLLAHLPSESVQACH